MSLISLLFCTATLLPYSLSHTLFGFNSIIIMEAMLQQSRAMCPFLKRTAPAALRTLSTATRPSTGGGTMSNLQVLARRCPVMSKALAVQSARLSSTKRFTSSAAGVPAAKPFLAPSNKRALHTTGGHPASAAPGTYKKNEQGEFPTESRF